MARKTSAWPSCGTLWRVKTPSMADVVRDVLLFAQRGAGFWRIAELHLPAIEALPSVQQALKVDTDADSRFAAIEKVLGQACLALESPWREVALDHLGFSEATRPVASRTQRENLAAQRIYVDGRTYRRAVPRDGRYASWLTKTITRVAEAALANEPSVAPPWVRDAALERGSSKKHARRAGLKDRGQPRSRVVANRAWADVAAAWSELELGQAEQGPSLHDARDHLINALRDASRNNARTSDRERWLGDLRRLADLDLGLPLQRDILNLLVFAKQHARWPVIEVPEVFGHNSGDRRRQIQEAT